MPPGAEARADAAVGEIREAGASGVLGVSALGKMDLSPRPVGRPIRP
jgi:hypothetical protein